MTVNQRNHKSIMQSENVLIFEGGINALGLKIKNLVFIYNAIQLL